MLYLISVLSFSDYDPHTVAVAKAVGTEKGKHISVNATVVFFAVNVLIEDNRTSVISAI